jgi:biotin carboxyl carrier protein
MRRLIFSRNKAAAAAHPLEAGDLCMALGKGEKEKHLATVVKGKRVIFFDDGSETEVDAVQVVEATPADRRAAKERYEAALSEAKKIATADTEETVDAAIEQVKAAMGGSLGSDGMISYLFSAGDEAKEGQLLCEALIGNFGTLATASPGARWMSSHWREACEEADTDKSGTISNDEAVLLWDRVAQSISETVTKKLDVLGAPPRLYRGDLCLALPIATDVDERAPDRRYLATYVDSTHVSYFDGLGEVLEVRSIEPVTPAARENAILRYSKAVSQCKMAARRPSDEVVKAAIAKVKSGMGGSLGADNAIDYQAAAGDEAREGHLLVQVIGGLLCRPWPPLSSPRTALSPPFLPARTPSALPHSLSPPPL